MSDICQQRLIHELPQKFKVSQQHLDDLTQQMSAEDRESMNRFAHGFQAEDWYCSLFSELPWSILIHGLEQNQFPKRSKSDYQVPDFLALIETTSLSHVPLLIEVKRVTSNKKSLLIRESQATLIEQYAKTVGVTLLYATYWDFFGLWTINTPDSFEKKSSRRKLTLLHSLELDCSGVFGDVSYLVIPPVTRTMEFSTDPSQSHEVRHPTYGTLVSDTVSRSNYQRQLTTLQSAAFDAIFEMKRIQTSKEGTSTVITESLENICSIKFSWWIARHLAMFENLPQTEFVNVSANVISELAEQLDFPSMTMFPSEATPAITALQRLCFISNGNNIEAT